MHSLSPTNAALEEAITILRAGGVVAHATETCYGLACDLANPAAVATLFAIKQRPLGQPVSALFPSVDEAKQWVVWNGRAQELAVTYLPGPLTLILPMRTDAPSPLYPFPRREKLEVRRQKTEKLTSDFSLLPSTLGIRVSSHPLATALVTRFGGVLSTTSANVHGEANPYDAHAIAARFERETAQPDLILDSGVLPIVPPSTVIDLTGESPQTRRQGETAPTPVSP